MAAETPSVQQGRELPVSATRSGWVNECVWPPLVTVLGCSPRQGLPLARFLPGVPVNKEKRGTRNDSSRRFLRRLCLRDLTPRTQVPDTNEKARSSHPQACVAPLPMSVVTGADHTHHPTGNQERRWPSEAGKGATFLAPPPQNLKKGRGLADPFGASALRNYGIRLCYAKPLKRRPLLTAAIRD